MVREVKNIHHVGGHNILNNNNMIPEIEAESSYQIEPLSSAIIKTTKRLLEESKIELRNGI